jgi:group I intron endonuclease
MYGIIYCATCVKTGRRYIGKTTQGLATRKVKHKHDSKYRDCYFYNAAKKYGWDSFEWKILDEAYDEVNLNTKEKYWVSFFDSTNHKKGYNIQKGGQGQIHSEETKMKIRETKLGKKNPMFGKCGKLHHAYGTHASEETRRKSSESHKGKKLTLNSIIKRTGSRKKNGWNRNPKKRGKENPCSKPILQFSINNEFIQEWGNASEAENKLNFKKGNISRVCRGIGKTAYGFIWKYK